MKIKLNEFDFEIQYLSIKENIADALFKIQIEECNAIEKDVASKVLTIYSADRENENYMAICEKSLIKYV